jgi:hypothetical protein
MRSPAKWPGDLQDPASGVHPRAAPRRGGSRHPRAAPTGRDVSRETPGAQQLLARQCGRGSTASKWGFAVRRAHTAAQRSRGSRPRKGDAPLSPSIGSPSGKPTPAREGAVSRETASGTRRSGRGRHSRGTEPLSPAHPSACGVRSGRCWSPHAKGARAARRNEGTVSRETRRVRRCWSAPPFHVKQRQPHRRASELLAMSRRPSAPLLRLAVTTFVPVARNRDAVPGAAGRVGPHQRRYPAHCGR